MYWYKVDLREFRLSVYLLEGMISVKGEFITNMYWYKVLFLFGLDVIVNDIGQQPRHISFFQKPFKR